MSHTAAVLMLPFHKESDDAGTKTTASHAAEILEDLRLAEGVERALRATGHMPLRAIQIYVCGRVAILQGRVASYYLKQVAQAAALSVLGIEGLRNDLEVAAGEQGRQGSSAY